MYKCDVCGSTFTEQQYVLMRRNCNGDHICPVCGADSHYGSADVYAVPQATAAAKEAING